ncbi:MAG: hypothetical protein WC374_07585 [Phycisphaerae bacterium]|jgi:hypothetical protein
MEPQTAVLDGREIEYCACWCGRSVVYDDIIMSMEEFCNAAKT